MKVLDKYDRICNDAHRMSKCSVATNIGWYAVKVRNRNELRISDDFQKNLGFQTLVPLQNVCKRRNGKKIMASRPILSSYVFINTDVSSINWKLFYSHSGVFGILRENGEAAAIPQEQITALEKLAASDKMVYEFDYSALKKGDRVEILDGPLRGAMGSFIKNNEKTGRFVVCLDLFKRALCTEVEIDLIKPC